MTSHIPSFEDDLHELMALAVVAGRYGSEVDVLNIYLAWEAYYPNDALGAVGRGLKHFVDGDIAQALAVIDEVASGTKTRADQARDVLAALKADLSLTEEYT